MSPPACRATLVRRDGLDTETPLCAAAIARFESLPSSDLACAADADCLVYLAGGGCLGVGIASAAIARMDPVPIPCVSEGCVLLYFDDHHMVCRDGCCEMSEQ